MKHKQMPLSDRTKEIVLGSLLGDGSLKIHKGYSNARFSFRHSKSQSKYFLWKANALEEISSSKKIFLQHNDGGFSSQDKLRYQSRAGEPLTEIYHLTAKRGKLRITRKWLNQMTALSLAIWWLDDGSLIANSRKGVFCTDGFDKESVKIIAQYLDKVWNIHTHIGAIKEKRAGRKQEYYRLWVSSTDEMKKFLRIILPYVPVPSMLYKVLLLYKDQCLQQRWISEVEKLSIFPRKIIEEKLKEKRNKWKNFRK